MIMRLRTICCRAYPEIVDVENGPDPLGIYQKNPICSVCRRYQPRMQVYGKGDLVAGDRVMLPGELVYETVHSVTERANAFTYFNKEGLNERPFIHIRAHEACEE